MKHFLSKATKYLSSIVTFSFLSTSVFASSASAGQVVALKLLARPNGAPEQCLSVDISKIGIVAGAETAKVESCRNIQEMRFIKDDAGNGFFRYRVQNNSPSGQSQCLGVDGTKIGILPNAPWMRFEPCRAIQELQFRPINYNNGWFNLQLQSNLPYCAGVDGTKIGIIPGAQNLRAEGCRGIQELYWQEVVLDVPQQPVQTPRQINMRPPVVSPQPLPNPNFSGNLIRTGGSGAINTRLPNNGVLFGGGGVDFNGEAKSVLPESLSGNQWIYGGIQTATFCNGPGGYSAKVSGKFITSQGLSIASVDFKLYSQLDYGVNFVGQKIGFPSNENWRPLSPGIKDNNYNWVYNSFPVIFYVTPSANISTPVRFSTHVRVNASGLTNFPIYDLGGIIDLGIIPNGECKNYTR